MRLVDTTTPPTAFALARSRGAHGARGARCLACWHGVMAETGETDPWDLPVSVGFWRSPSPPPSSVWELSQLQLLTWLRGVKAPVWSSDFMVFRSNHVSSRECIVLDGSW